MKGTTSEDRIYMQRCIELATNGALYARPNPMVGCVIVYNGKIIGEGFHHKYGEPHAEVNAINSVKEKELLKKSTLYVNLEPCSHYGKTPPCADLIIEHKIQRVVVGNQDPHEKVRGQGTEKLKKSGCEVITGVLEEECSDLNKMFFTYHIKKRPYVILKWAESADGFIDKIRDEKDEIGPNWITNEKSRQLVHKWRAECQAIMVGVNTIKKDNPELNVRSWPGNHPTRVIIDKYNDIPQHAAILNHKVPTIIFNPKKNGTEENLQFVKLDSKQDNISSVLNYLHSMNIISLFVEGGARLINDFITNGLWDEARVFRGNTRFHKGIDAPYPSHAFRQCDTVFDTQIIHMYPKSVN